MPIDGRVEEEHALQETSRCKKGIVDSVWADVLVVQVIVYPSGPFSKEEEEDNHAIDRSP